MNSKKKLFYGWYMVAVSFLLLLVLQGLKPGWWNSFHSNPISEEMGWHFSEVARAIPPGILFLALVPLFVGLLVDSYGAKKVMLGGCILSSLGLFLLASISLFWHFALLHFLVSAGIVAATYIPIYVLLLTWFKRRRGLAIGLALMGGSLGPILSLTYRVYLMPQGSLEWRGMFLLLGGAATILTFLVLLLIKNRPFDKGLHPDGTAEDEDELEESEGHTIGEVSGLSTFWFIVGGVFLLKILPASGLFPMFIMRNFADKGQSVVESMVASEYLRFGLVFAMPLIGMLSDRWGPRITCLAVLCFAAAAMGLAIFLSPHWMVVVGMNLEEILSIVLLILIPLIIADSHGLKNFGIIYAVIIFLGGLGTGIGSLSYGLISDITFDRTYAVRSILALQAVLLLLGAYLISKAKPLGDPAPADLKSAS